MNMEEGNILVKNVVVRIIVSMERGSDIVKSVVVLHFVGMVKEKIERKIAVIFATDVVGYSKHMEADETETIHNLRKCEAILAGLFDKHDGRLFNTGGDSFLAEFPSAVSAVECAVEFQKGIKERNASGDTSVKLEFRIGINSGDVVKEKDNLLNEINDKKKWYLRLF